MSSGVHTQLMREMHSPNGAYDPMPPSQLAFLMDASQPPEIRALGFVCWKTVHPTRRGKSFQRQAFMRDERGALGVKHCGDYFRDAFFATRKGASTSMGTCPSHP
jgi:hypothetical protein